MVGWNDACKQGNLAAVRVQHLFIGARAIRHGWWCAVRHAQADVVRFLMHRISKDEQARALEQVIQPTRRGCSLIVALLESPLLTSNSLAIGLCAVRDGYVETAQEYCRKHASARQTLLVLAAECNQLEIFARVMRLLDVYTVPWNETLMAAACQGHVDILRYAAQVHPPHLDSGAWHDALIAAAKHAWPPNGALPSGSRPEQHLSGTGRSAARDEPE
jgi:hypothetical protein